MRFHSPLDDVQWNAAAKHYTDMRSSIRGLREMHPPASVTEREILRRLREVVQDFGRELQKPRDRIDPSRLNALSAAMIRIAIDYIVAHQAPPMR